MLALWLQRISVRVQCLDQSQQLSSSMKKLPARPSTLKIEMDLNNLLHETASWLILFVIQISNAGPFTQLSCKTARCSSLTNDNDTNISTLWALNGGGSRLPNLFVVKSKEIISSILFLLPTLILFLAKRWVFLSETHHFDKKIYIYFSKNNAWLWKISLIDLCTCKGYMFSPFYYLKCCISCFDFISRIIWVYICFSVLFSRTSVVYYNVVQFCYIRLCRDDCCSNRVSVEEENEGGRNILMHPIFHMLDPVGVKMYAFSMITFWCTLVGAS